MIVRSAWVRFLSLVFVFSILASLQTFSVDVEYAGFVEESLFHAPRKVGGGSELENDIEKALENYDSEIDVSRYGYMTHKQITADGKEVWTVPSELEDTYENVVYSDPNLFWATSGFGFSFNETTGNITKISPRYSIEKEEIPARQKKIDEEFKKISSYIKKDMSDEEIALVVHDYFCTHYKYDMRSVSDIPHESFTIEGVLSYGLGVCQSYALAYEYVLEKFGIECVTVQSSVMQHMWNLVKIDREWYHVDVTWDDPSKVYNVGGADDMAGLAAHDYFLISDETILAEGHSGWNSGISCDSVKFEDAVWIDSDSAVVFGKKNYYVAEKNGDIVAVDRKNGKSKVIYTVEDFWSAGGESYYPNEKYTRLAIVRDRIYFTSNNKIYSMNEDGKDIVLEFTAEGDVAIFGMYEDDGKLLYAANTNFETPIVINGEFTALPIKIKDVHLNKPEYKLGVGQKLDIGVDVNSGAEKKDLIWESSDEAIAVIINNKVVPKSKGKVKIKAVSPDNDNVFDEIELEITSIFGDGDGDGQTNTKDAVIMAQKLAKWTIDTSEDFDDICDVYLDGVVDIKDAVLLAQYLAGWDVSLHTPIS